MDAYKEGISQNLLSLIITFLRFRFSKKCSIEDITGSTYFLIFSIYQKVHDICSHYMM